MNYIQFVTEKMGNQKNTINDGHGPHKQAWLAIQKRDAF